MKISTLTKVADLEIFRNTAAKYIDVLLPLEYLLRSKVVVCCAPNGEYCGGYMLVKQGPLRVIESIPNNDYVKERIEMNNVAEITGLWLDSNKACTRFCSIIFWLKLYLDLSFSKFDGFVYAYTLKKKNLAKIYSTFKPTTLFEGATIQLAGMDNPELEAVEYINRKNVVLAPFVHFNFLLRRFNVESKRLWRQSNIFTRVCSMAPVSFFKNML